MMTQPSPVFVFFFLNATGLALAALAAIFFLRRNLWGRAGVATMIGAALSASLWRTAAGAFDIIFSIVHPGLRLAGVSTAVFVPLIIAEIARQRFVGSVREVENLLIKANDTDDWSPAWRARFVEEHRDAILSSSTAIQRDYIRRRRAPLSPLVYFAAIMLGEERQTIARYLAADREEPRRQLELAQNGMEGDT